MGPRGPPGATGPHLGTIIRGYLFKPLIPLAWQTDETVEKKDNPPMMVRRCGEVAAGGPLGASDLLMVFDDASGVRQPLGLSSPALWDQI